jgi:hypothetical protein
MSAESATLAGQAAAEQFMVDTCTIVRVTGVTTDPVNGRPTETTAPVYAGKCRIQQHTGSGRGAAGNRADVGEASVVQVTFELQLPMSAARVLVEDRVTITASALDPQLVGRVWRVAGQAAKTHATSRRVEIREVGS